MRRIDAANAAVIVHIRLVMIASMTRQTQRGTRHYSGRAMSEIVDDEGQPVVVVAVLLDHRGEAFADARPAHCLLTHLPSCDVWLQ